MTLETILLIGLKADRLDDGDEVVVGELERLSSRLCGMGECMVCSKGVAVEK